MRRRLVLILSLLVILSFLHYVRPNLVEVEAPTGYPVHNLDTGLNYTTIQEAIDANETKDGHTIFVESGIYYECVVVDKSLSILGEDKEGTIVDGNWTGNVIFIVANNVSICNFTLRNTGSLWKEDMNILLDKANNTTIQDNVIVNGDYGIYFEQSSHNIIEGNVISEINSYGVLVHSLSGHNIFVDNRITNNSIYGIHVGSHAGKGNIFMHNNISFNGREGIYIVHTNSTVVANNFISSNGLEGWPPDSGIRLYYSSNNIIENNTISFNPEGVFVYCSRGSLPSVYNTIANNVISNNGFGVILRNDSGPSHSFNRIYGNTFMNNGVGIFIDRMESNSVYHNNVIDNYVQAFSFESNNTWDNGVEGNYWSNYNGTDTNRDGIGNTPFLIDVNNTDNYPLMGMFNCFNTSVGKPVNVISNSTVNSFDYSEANNTIRLYLSNITESQTHGFCRVCIPKDLIAPNYTVTIRSDGEPVDPLYFNNTIYDNSTHRWIYFAYEHSTLEIIIVPEFPSYLILPLVMMATLLVVIVYRRKGHD